VAAAPTAAAGTPASLDEGLSSFSLPHSSSYGESIQTQQVEMMNKRAPSSIHRPQRGPVPWDPLRRADERGHPLAPRHAQGAVGGGAADPGQGAPGVSQANTGPPLHPVQDPVDSLHTGKVLQEPLPHQIQCQDPVARLRDLQLLSECYPPRWAGTVDALEYGNSCPSQAQPPGQPPDARYAGKVSPAGLRGPNCTAWPSLLTEGPYNIHIISMET
jgi:hypothetical protein